MVEELNLSTLKPSQVFLLQTFGGYPMKYQFRVFLPIFVLKVFSIFLLSRKLLKVFNTTNIAPQRG